MLKIRQLVLLFLCGFYPLIFAQELFEFFNQNEAFKRAYIGICIVDIETGKEVYNLHAEHYFVPASLQKIPLSAVAISLLGNDFRFSTDLKYQGSIENGILHGDLLIRGGGDPTFSLDDMNRWKEQLTKEGIHKIDGKILLDASCFETVMASPYWYFEDLGNYYGAGASALTINQNSYRITFKPASREGDPAEVVKIDPPIPQLNIHNEVTTGPKGSGDQVVVFGSEYSPIQFYRGTVPIDQPSFTVKAAIPNPPLFCGQYLLGQIEAVKGIETLLQPMNHSSWRLLSRKESPSLKEIIAEMNQFSINLYAEHLLKMIGSGSALKGAKISETFLKDLGIPTQFKDGAGIARNNLITPKGFALLLCKIRKEPLYQSIYDSFPEPGKPGSLRFFSEIPETSLRAKTGSMSNTFNLGGYLLLSSGKEVAFSIFCNNYKGSLSEIKNEMQLFLSAFAKLKN